MGQRKKGQSFVPGEITPEETNRMGCELARRFTKGNHAFIVCTHIHNHIIWNSTSLDHTRKFQNFLGSTHAVRRLNDTICVENDYSIVVNPKRRGKSYNQWLGSKPPSYRDQLRKLIDDALAQRPAAPDALLKQLRRKKYPPRRSAEGESAGGYAGKAPGRKGNICVGPACLT